MLSLLLFLILIISCFFSLTIGPADISFWDILKGFQAGKHDTIPIIIWEIRLPRTLLALSIGATLGISGAALQGLVRNPLASPSLLGASNFAALGAVLAIYFASGAQYPIFIFVCAIGASIISVFILMVISGQDSRILTLIPLWIGFILPRKCFDSLGSQSCSKSFCYR